MDKTILVVEDEVIIADHLCMELRNSGYQTLEPALTFQEALLAINQYQPDLVILDIDLNEELSGINLGAYLTDEKQIPFIYLTSIDNKQVLDAAKATLPYAYLSKPFRPKDVTASLELAFVNHRALRRNLNPEAMINLDLLTATEKVVLRKIAVGLTTREIAVQLGVSPNTVKNHRYNICNKLELKEGTHSLKYWVIEHQATIRAMAS